MKRLSVLVAGASVAAAALLGIGTPVFAQQTVNYGVQPATMPIYIARELGLLDPIEKKHNVKIVFRNFASGAPENQAMAAGELQMASAGMGPAIIAASRLPSTLVAITILEQTAILVPKDSPLKSVKELKGKKIAFPGEGSQQYRSEEHTSELQSLAYLVCRLLLEKKKKKQDNSIRTCHDDRE